jgi:hypothetical protein
MERVEQAEALLLNETARGCDVWFKRYSQKSQKIEPKE